jgi:hypothetical protein
MHVLLLHVKHNTNILLHLQENSDTHTPESPPRRATRVTETLAAASPSFAAARAGRRDARAACDDGGGGACFPFFGRSKRVRPPGPLEDARRRGRWPAAMRSCGCGSDMAPARSGASGRGVRMGRRGSAGGGGTRR